MPPPNANGNLHIGHGLTVALEDSLTRYYRLRGASAWYIPGADHAGFETWVVYERNLEAKGHTRFEFDRNELYARVWDFVAEQRGNMELQLRALGASCSWDDLTFTLDENVIDRVYTTFEKMWNDGMIYRGEKLGKDKKSVSMRVILRAPDRTLTVEEADKVSKKILGSMEHQLGITLRS